MPISSEWHRVEIWPFWVFLRTEKILSKFTCLAKKFSTFSIPFFQTTSKWWYWVKSSSKIQFSLILFHMSVELNSLMAHIFWNIPSLQRTSGYMSIRNLPWLHYNSFLKFASGIGNSEMICFYHLKSVKIANTIFSAWTLPTLLPDLSTKKPTVP